MKYDLVQSKEYVQCKKIKIIMYYVWGHERYIQ